MLLKYYCCTFWNAFINFLSKFIPFKDFKTKFVQCLSIPKKIVIKETVKKIIKDKKAILENTENNINTVCLIGHSQFHKWDIGELFGLKVRNCGINGISMVEYREKILEKKLLNCNSKIHIILGGTNDIIYNRTPKEILSELQFLVNYIKSNNKNRSNIYFIACLNVNNRKDRDNITIDKLNSYIKNNLPEGIKYISVNDMNDKQGCLKSEYTHDGLHLSKSGYAKLKEILESNVCKC